jgi:thiol-disulfide isomerase/thioredoxin
MLISRERLVLLGVVAVAAAGAAWLSRDTLLAPIPVQPRPAPAAPAPRLPAQGAPRPVTLHDGTSRDLAVPPGKLLVVHFWATWCPPCVEEFPGLASWARSVKGDPSVEILAVSVDTDWKTVDEFLKKTGTSGLPVALDPRRTTALAFGTEKFPETWFLGPDGKVLDQFIGPVDWTAAATRKRLEELRARTASPGGAVGQ